MPKTIKVSDETWKQIAFLKIEKGKRDMAGVIDDLLAYAKLTDYRTTKNTKDEKKPFSSLNDLKT